MGQWDSKPHLLKGDRHTCTGDTGASANLDRAMVDEFGLVEEKDWRPAPWAPFAGRSMKCRELVEVLMSKFVREAGAGCGRSVVIRLAAVLIAVPLFCLLIVVPLGLVARLGLNPLWLALPAGLYLLLILGGGLGGLAWVVARRRKQLDELCAPLGLTGSLYQLFFRQYHGTVDGRQVAIYFYRGPAVEIDVESTLATRFAVTQADSDTRFLAGLFKREPLVLDDPTMERLWAATLDEEWARTLLTEPEIPPFLQRLVDFAGSFTRRHVVLRPGAWRLTLFGSARLLDFNFNLTPERMRTLLDDLLALIQIAEALPAPGVTAEESSAERMARRMRERNPYLLPAITAGALLIIFCLAAVIATVGVLLVSGS